MSTVRKLERFQLWNTLWTIIIQCTKHEHVVFFTEKTCFTIENAIFVTIWVLMFCIGGHVLKQSPYVKCPTIGCFKSQIQYNRQLQWYKLVPLLCMEKHFLAWFSEKNSPKTKFFECWFASKNRFLQKMASNKNVNQTQEKKSFISDFFQKTLCFVHKSWVFKRTVDIKWYKLVSRFFRKSQIQYNCTIHFKNCIVLCCTHKSLDRYTSFMWFTEINLFRAWAVDSFIMQRCRQKCPTMCSKRSFGYENKARKSFKSIIGDLHFPLFCYLFSLENG